jgi:hypothetical protein
LAAQTILNPAVRSNGFAPGPDAGAEMCLRCATRRNIKLSKGSLWRSESSARNATVAIDIYCFARIDYLRALRDDEPKN